jgi:hypothetical protein
VAIRRVRDLDIDEDLAFERRSLIVERIGTGLMVVLLVAAMLGLLGSGPLSHATVRAEGLIVDFQRFSRYESSETLRLHIDETATRDPEVRVWLDRRYLDDSRIESVLPVPVRVEGAADRVVYIFAVAEKERPLVVSLSRLPERIGPVRGRAGIEGPATSGGVEFRQFVFP